MYSPGVNREQGFSFYACNARSCDLLNPVTHEWGGGSLYAVSSFLRFLAFFGQHPQIKKCSRHKIKGQGGSIEESFAYRRCNALIFFV